MANWSAEQQREAIETLRDVRAALKRWVQNIIYMPTTNERGEWVNGYAGVICADWDVRQRLDDIEHALRGLDEEHAR